MSPRTMAAAALLLGAFVLLAASGGSSAHAQSTDDCASNSIAASYLGVSIGGSPAWWSPSQVQQTIRQHCRPGDMVRIYAVHAPLFCDYGKQIVQEGRGVVSCVMKGQ